MSRRSTRSNLMTTEILGTPAMPTHAMPSIATMGALPKPPKPPEKPLIPYMRYSRKVWEEVKTANPELKLWEIGKIIGQQWREMPAVDRQQYVDEYEVDKIEHVEQLKQYHSSPAYQAYLHAKSRAEAMETVEALADKDDAYMSIEPTDEGADDSDLSTSVKHVAAARFQRNHRLINDILGETTPVPSTKSIITTSRLGVLKNQVQSLELHRERLETELAQLEDTFEEKKRKMSVMMDDFDREVKRLKSMTPQEYYKEHKLKQQQSAPASQDKPVDNNQKKSKNDLNSKNNEGKDQIGIVVESSDLAKESEAKDENKNVEDKPPNQDSEEQMDTDKIAEDTSNQTDNAELPSGELDQQIEKSAEDHDQNVTEKVAVETVTSVSSKNDSEGTTTSDAVTEEKKEK